MACLQATHRLVKPNAYSCPGSEFTLAPDYPITKLDIDGRPLYKGEKIDFYAQEIRPTKLMALGTFSLNKGKLTITVFNKNPKSSGYHFGLDEIQLVPAK